MQHLEASLQQKRELIEAALREELPGRDTYPEVLFESIHYSLFDGGKRLRPILVLAAAEAVGGKLETVLPVACALECIHTYSLIHDDLPSIDNHAYRRGKLANHRKFGPATALLTGDALQSLAFEVLTHPRHAATVNPERLLQVVYEVAQAVGPQGMVGGQVVDTISDLFQEDLKTLEYIHHHKTGALIEVSVRAGALLSDAAEEQIEQLGRYARALGLAFQIVDDILDVVGQAEELGKPVGEDEKLSKMTYPALLGLEQSRRLAQQLGQEALETLRGFGPMAETLRGLAHYVVARTH
ncbi:MAG: polyprenyl synthetase family protein [Candidatus Tectomicrobia bacterium]|nr:polyprenyl synthetase family protein [Candidatus Tectomicrobia bacterium]